MMKESPKHEDDRLQPLPPQLYDEAYFLTACEGYHEFIKTEGRNLSRRLEQTFAIAGIKPNMRVLDVGSGRGEVVRYCARLGAECYGVDFSPAANQIAQRFAANEETIGTTAFIQSDAKTLPLSSGFFDRVLMLDLVEHLQPWELNQAFLEVHRVLKKDGRLIIHTAPNRWYDRYAYPLVRLYRTLQGQGVKYPKNPRECYPLNVQVHVNEQDMLSLSRSLRRAGFSSRIWLDSPPQERQEGPFLATLRRVAFGVPPLRWFFEREVFAVARKRHLNAGKS